MAVAARSLPVRVGIYARISSDREGDQLGVRRQVEDCRRLAERLEYEVAGLYVDDDISAWSGKARQVKGGLQMSILPCQAANQTLVWTLPRSSRSRGPSELAPELLTLSKLRPPIRLSQTRAA